MNALTGHAETKPLEVTKHGYVLTNLSHSWQTRGAARGGEFPTYMDSFRSDSPVALTKWFQPNRRCTSLQSLSVEQVPD